MQVAELAAERVDQGVVAFGIGGSEERGPAEWFTDVVRVRAASAGLHLHGACGREHGAGIDLGGAGTGRGADRARHRARSTTRR